MKKVIMLLSFSSLFLMLLACSGGAKEEGKDKQWSKPQRVLEGCDGVRGNSKQCQQNPNTQQMMIQIDRR